jgi:hypothetical protein
MTAHFLDFKHYSAKHFAADFPAPVRMGYIVVLAENAF